MPTATRRRGKKREPTIMVVGAAASCLQAATPAGGSLAACGEPTELVILCIMHGLLLPVMVVQ